MGLVKQRIPFQGDTLMNIPLTLKEAERILEKIATNEPVEQSELVRFLEFVRKNPDFKIRDDSAEPKPSEE